MTRTAVMACVLASVAGAAQASTVEFRIVERRGQSSWDGVSSALPLNDNVLNFAVQARVVGGGTNESLGNFGFDILSNDPQASGTLSKARISAVTTNPITGASIGSYDVGPFQYNSNATTGTGGLSGVYAYLAGINPNFNGLINTSGGSFTANPAINSIGLVTGSPTGGSLLLYTDSTGSGNPDTYVSGNSAALSPTVALTYLGSGGNFSDVYHFNYVISSNAARTLTFSLANAQAQTFASLALANGVWGPGNPLNAMGVTSTGASITITPAPASVALLGLGGLVAARRRRA